MTVKHFPNDSALSCKIAKFYISPSFILTVVLSNDFNGPRRFPKSAMLLNKCFYMLLPEVRLVADGDEVLFVMKSEEVCSNFLPCSFRDFTRHKLSLIHI